MKEKIVVIVCLVIQILLLSGCNDILEASVGIDEANEAKEEMLGDAGQYDVTNNDCSTSSVEAIEINLNNLMQKTEDSYTVSGQRLTICEAGNYVLYGKLQSGSVVIHVYDDEIVHLILENAEINAEDEPAILVEKADKVIITAAEGTKNIISDSHRHSGEYQACIFSNVDLTINGTGELFVYGYHADAVHSKDQLKIINTNFSARAKEDGVRGNDGVIILNSAVDIECEGSGIVANSPKDMAVVQGGSCKVIAGENAVAANRYVAFSDCQTDLYSVLETVRCNGIRNFDEEFIK